jgi:hypothetical protein
VVRSSFSLTADQYYLGYTKTSEQKGKGLLRELSTNTNRDVSLCATTAVVLNATELIVEKPLQLMNHIAGARALVKESRWDARSAGIGAAAFWVNVTMEVLCCLQYNWQVAWHPEDWGVDMDFEHVDAKEIGLPQDIWVHRMVNILARTVNFRATTPRYQEQADAALETRLAEWTNLTNMCYHWTSKIPHCMRPLAIIPTERTRSKSNFPEIW